MLSGEGIWSPLPSSGPLSRGSGPLSRLRERARVRVCLCFALAVTAACSSGASGTPDGGTAGSSGSSGTAGASGTIGTGGTAGTTGSAGTGGTAASCLGTKPTAANTGVPAGVSLTVVNGNVMVTQDGTTIDAQDIHGFLTIAASNVHVTRTIVRGPSTPYTQNAGVIRINSGSNILIEDVEIAVAAPSATVDGMWGDNFT